MEDAVDRVFQRQLTRTDARRVLDGVPDKDRSGYFFTVLTNFAASTPPDQSEVPTTEEIEDAAERCSGYKSYEVVKKRLTRFFDPERTLTKCLYCACNNVCMARGCNARPLDSSTERFSTMHRCTPGVHLCSKHGQAINVNRKTCSTVSTLLLDDGRTIRNVWASQPGHVTRKRHLRHEDTKERYKQRRTEATTRLNKYVQHLGIGDLNAKEGMDVMIEFLTNQLQKN